MNLKVALLQLLPGKGLTEQTMIGKKACEQAKAMGAHIALFPEMWSSGYYIPQDEKAVNELSVSVKDDFVHGFRALAADLEMAIGITFLERHEPRPLNSSFFLTEKGRKCFIILRYTPVHLLMRRCCQRAKTFMWRIWMLEKT